MAVEAQHKLQRSCSECTLGEMNRYGCGKDAGDIYKLSGAPHRWTSPILQCPPPKDSQQYNPENIGLIYECPVGYLLREHSWVFDVIDTASRVEQCGPREWLALPRWFRHASRLVLSERQRLREEEQEQRRAAL